jgi:protein CpxP
MQMTMEKRMMRTAAVALCALGLSAGMAMAQDAPPPPPQQGGQTQGPPPGGRGGNPERRLEMLQKRLNLTDDQTTQMKAIMGDERSKTEALRSNTALTPQDRRTQMMAIHQDGETKIHALLTPEQKTKYDDLEAKQRERMEERRKDGPPPTAPSGGGPAPTAQR